MKAKNIPYILKGMKNRLLNATNNSICHYIGHQLRVIHVVEYLKCGETWLSEMLRLYNEVDKSFGTYNVMTQSK